MDTTERSFHQRPGGTKVFIGHGRSLVWHQLKTYLTDLADQKIQCDEFNAESVAGATTVERLRQMVDRAQFAFLVMTGEDLHGDGAVHARDNVIHEAGLCQGSLGYERAIILLEEGCTPPSNLDGLTVIPFPCGNIAPAYDAIRRVLEREGIVRTVVPPQPTPRRTIYAWIGRALAVLLVAVAVGVLWRVVWRPQVINIDNPQLWRSNSGAAFPIEPPIALRWGDQNPKHVAINVHGQDRTTCEEKQLQTGEVLGRECFPDKSTVYQIKVYPYPRNGSADDVLYIYFTNRPVK